MTSVRHHNALAAGYCLHWYRIESVLGQGGFGITYLATDTNLDQPVAIKEFLPSDLAVRTQDSSVHPVSDARGDTFAWGLSRFLTEARTLAQFRHPNIVRVYSVFEANGTAYMVMEYERGTSLEDAFKFRHMEGEAALLSLVHALMDGLELVHQAGFIHRDIKPDNIFMRANDGVPVLLDFGSARQAVGVQAKTLTSLVTPGYAPFEQYNATRDNDRQGPWSDIYSLAATLYRGITGNGPVDALARADAMLSGSPDPLIPLVSAEPMGFSRALLDAVDAGLAFQPQDRPQSLSEWRSRLPTRPTVPDFTIAARAPQSVPPVSADAMTEVRPAKAPSGAATDPAQPPVPDAPTQVVPPPESPRRSLRTPALVALVLALVAGGWSAWWLFPGREAVAPRDDTVAPAPSAPTAPQSTIVAPATESPAAEQPPAPTPDAASQLVEERRRLEAERSALADERAKLAFEEEQRRLAQARRAAEQQARQVAEDRERLERERQELDALRAAEEARAAQAAAEARAAEEARAAQAAAGTRAAEEARAAQAAAEARAAEEARAAQAAAETRAAEEARAAQAAAEARADEETRAAKAAAEARGAEAERAAQQAGSPESRTDREAELKALLEAAAADVEALRLTSPPGRNAFERYQEALTLDPDNAEAREGLERIVTRYLGLAEAAMRERDFARGSTMLDRAARIDPDDPRVAAMRETLAEARREAEARDAEARRIATAPAGQQAGDEPARNAAAEPEVKLAVFPHDSNRPCFHPVGKSLHDAANRTASAMTSVQLAWSSYLSGASAVGQGSALWQGNAARKTPQVSAVRAAARTLGADAVLMAWYDCQSGSEALESTYRADVYLVDVRTGEVYFASRGVPETLKAARTVFRALFAARGL